MDYLETIKSQNFKEIFDIFFANKPTFAYAGNGSQTPQMTAYNQYEVDGHDVLNTNIRKKKVVYRPIINEANGTPELNTDGSAKTVRSESDVVRVPLPFQYLIVERRIGFLLGNEITYKTIYNEDDKREIALITAIEKIEEDAKSYYKNKEIARRMMSELECAELWYLVEEKGGFWASASQSIGLSQQKYQLKMKVLSPSLNDNLYPLFDNYGDMVAFGRGYKTIEGDKEIERFDVYIAEFTYKYVKRDDWKIDEQAAGGGIIVNEAKKIPIVYHSQKKPEWSNVQGMIDRIEEVLSGHGEMNKYFGEPILAIFGNLIQAINKGDSGKMLQLSENAKASFLALDSPPESIKMEVENLEKFIYAMSQTPNIAFAELKNIGALSGIALKMMFLDAHLAAKSKEEIFGIGIQRRYNLLKSFVGNVLDLSLQQASKSVTIKPVFTPYMPLDLKDAIETLVVSVASEILSKETATEKLEDMGFISDAEQEFERLKTESEERAKLQSSIGANSFGF